MLLLQFLDFFYLCLLCTQIFFIIYVFYLFCISMIPAYVILTQMKVNYFKVQLGAT